ncbi:hypothetical protein TDB9533_00025 [Thalassocella blandensis]|nr:hypothetical protein TDB9533_00025 [Thalassocella blandensis]
MLNIDDNTLDLMKEILALSSGSIFANDIDRIAKKYAGHEPAKKLTFLNAFYSFLKSLPQGIWTNEKNRLTGLQTILVHLENEALKLHKDHSNSFKV